MIGSRTGLAKVTPDEVIFAFLANSRHLLDDGLGARFAEVGENRSWEERCRSRAIMSELGLLEPVTAREWFRASLSARQARRIFLGYGGSKREFQHTYSNGTYRLEVAARTMASNPESHDHHVQVVHDKARDIGVDALRDLILCAPNWCFNRKLKIFDGNHRAIAYVLRHGSLGAVECYVGLNRRFVFNLAQRVLLGFEYWEKVRSSAAFHLRRTYERVRNRMRGGRHYQPMLRDPGAWQGIVTRPDGDPLSPSESIAGNRPSTDRAVLMRDDLVELGLLESRGSLLDIGCNIGFFCHYFESLGFQSTGVDNSSHNQSERFTLANSIAVARQLNQRYGLNSDFHDADAVDYLRGRKEPFDVVLLLSVFHHYFLGYPLQSGKFDPMHEAREFIGQVQRITGRVLYLEYDEEVAVLPTNELISFLRDRAGFADVKVIGHSQDFGRPLLRCAR